MSIGNYLTALDEQRDQLARNLLTMGVQASETEKLNTLVPKVLQIPQTKPDITLFKVSIDALHDYGEKVYTFYNDGYRSLAGFTESYEHFCCEENGYAIYYNQPDFNWGAVIYTMCVEPVHISSNRKIMLSYKSGATDIGEMWLVPKSNQQMSEAERARHIYEAIQNNTAISIPFGWLGTVGNYINVLHECSGISDGEYYLAWKAVTDNTSPMIRSVKIVDDSYAMTPEEAELEADVFLSVIKGKQFEMPVYFDLEEKKQFDLGKEQVSAIMRAFLKRVESAGYTAPHLRSQLIPPMISSPGIRSGWRTGSIRPITAAHTVSGSTARKERSQVSAAMWIWISAIRISRPLSKARD